MNTMDHLKVMREKIIIRGVIEPLTPLHIGWQRSFDPMESDSPVIKDPRGNPYIPGSSFKGILRGFVEGFLSGAGVEGVCFPTDDEYCVGKDDWNNREVILQNACPVCRVFGSSFMGGKVKIKDMRVRAEEWHETFLRIRDGVAIDRESRTAKDRGKYNFETVAPGTEFLFEIVADNLEDHEKGLLFTAFNLISRGYGSLGGNVSRGTGRISVIVNEVEIFSPVDLFRQYRDKGDMEPVHKTGADLEAYREEMQQAFFSRYAAEEVTNV